MPRRNLLLFTPEDLWVARLTSVLLYVADQVGSVTEAKRLFQATIKRDPGRPRGSTRPEQDQKLLDMLAILDMKIAPAARRIHELFPGEYGPSATAIERRMGRANDARQARELLRCWNEKHKLH